MEVANKVAYREVKGTGSGSRPRIRADIKGIVSSAWLPDNSLSHQQLHSLFSAECNHGTLTGNEDVLVKINCISGGNAWGTWRKYLGL